MILLFLLILAFLALAILGELERGQVGPPPALACPGCSQATEADWLVCPRCRRLLQESCCGCGRQRGIQHLFCPWCGRRREEGR
ncbi:MAG: hypothetical protein IH614_14105 [Desulfuromonadales bacterium]|nr:hypothetical protein [Desulfuromonadales bacterium]